MSATITVGDTLQVGWALAQLRRRRGYTQKAMADLLGVTPATIANMEKGRHESRLSTVQRYAEVLDFRFVVTFMEVR